MEKYKIKRPSGFTASSVLSVSRNVLVKDHLPIMAYLHCRIRT